MSENYPTKHLTGNFVIPFTTDDHGHTKYKFYIDNYRLSTFTTCPTLFDYTQMQCYRPKRIGQAMTIGGWWSRVMELLYREMSFGRLVPVEDVIRFGADAWVENKVEASMTPHNLKLFGGAQAAIVMIMQYYNHTALNDFNNWQVIGTEVGFGLKDEVLVGEDDEVLVYLTGKPDVVVLEKSINQIVVGDHKTVDYVKKDTIIKFKPHPQTTGYVYAAKQIAQQLGINPKNTTDRCIINVASRNRPSEKPRDGIKKPRFTRAYPTYTHAELEEWRLGLLAKCREIKRAIESDTYIRHENSCHIYGGCSFRRVCSVPPGARHAALAADFVKVDPWTPYNPEEDAEQTQEENGG